MIEFRNRTRCTSASLSERHAIGTPQVQTLHVEDVLTGSDLFVFDSDDAPSGCRAESHWHCCRVTSTFSPGLVENAAEARITCQVTRKDCRVRSTGTVGVVGDGSDLSVVEVAQGHRLDQVVDVPACEGQIDALRSIDGPSR